MKCQVALVLVGFVALSSAYNGQLRKTLQPIPVPKNYHHRLAASQAGAGAPGSDFGAGAPGADFGAGAPAVDFRTVDFGAGAPGSDSGAGSPGAPGDIDIDLHAQQPAQVLYKSPTRVVERHPIRIATAPATSSYTHVSEDVPAPPPRRAAHQITAKKPASYDEEELTRQEQEFQHSARNAKYSFASAVDDGIQDQSHIRQETRDGLKVTGTYAYSDGYFKRTVNYEADENGYRVVDETVEPLGEEGPQIDLVNGKAEVHTQIGGVDTQYSVSADELAVNTKKANDFSKKEFLQ